MTGKDPLLEKLEGKDINSVAGVLKLYFRELKDPLFPFYMFDDLMACSSNCNFNSQSLFFVFVYVAYGTVVERWSLTGKLSLSCARPAADR